MAKAKREVNKTKQEGAWYAVHLHDNGMVKQLKKMEDAEGREERSATYYAQHNPNTGQPIVSPIFAAVVQAKDEDDALMKADKLKRKKLLGKELSG